MTLTNTGNATLNISKISITGTNPTSYRETTTCGSIPRRGKYTISVAFAPAAAGKLSATLTSADNAPPNPQSLTLSGTGVAAPTVRRAINERLAAEAGLHALRKLQALGGLEDVSVRAPADAR